MLSAISYLECANLQEIKQIKCIEASLVLKKYMPTYIHIICEPRL